jgi:hypothetical protein
LQLPTRSHFRTMTLTITFGCRQAPIIERSATSPIDSGLWESFSSIDGTRPVLDLVREIAAALPK